MLLLFPAFVLSSAKAFSNVRQSCYARLLSSLAVSLPSVCVVREGGIGRVQKDTKWYADSVPGSYIFFPLATSIFRCSFIHLSVSLSIYMFILLFVILFTHLYLLSFSTRHGFLLLSSISLFFFIYSSVCLSFCALIHLFVFLFSHLSLMSFFTYHGFLLLSSISLFICVSV